MMIETQAHPIAVQHVRIGIVDCDVHPMPRSSDEIKAYLPMPWRDRYGGGGRGFFGNPVHGARLDSVPPGGGPTGSDPDFLRKQLIDEFGVAYAILLPRAFCNLHPDPDFGAAIAAAFNDWLADTWLSTYNPDGVFKGSITVAHQDPVAAAREIERWAGHPHFVQVMMDSGAQAPYGHTGSPPTAAATSLDRHHDPSAAACRPQCGHDEDGDPAARTAGAPRARGHGRGRAAHEAQLCCAAAWTALKRRSHDAHDERGREPGHPQRGGGPRASPSRPAVGAAAAPPAPQRGRAPARPDRAAPASAAARPAPVPSPPRPGCAPSSALCCDAAHAGRRLPQLQRQVVPPRCPQRLHDRRMHRFRVHHNPVPRLGILRNRRQ
jgi:hypothetical protein